VNKVTETQAAYIAGFFDGEGCIHISLTRGRHSHCRYRCCLYITIGQKRPAVLYWIQKTLGYGLIQNKGPRCGYQWRLQNGRRGRLHFINTILPYTHVKTKELKTGLQFLKTVSYIGCRISNKDYQLRLKLRKKLQELKHENLQ
jgi:hypothetical protein